MSQPFVNRPVEHLLTDSVNTSDVEDVNSNGVSGASPAKTVVIQADTRLDTEAYTRFLTEVFGSAQGLIELAVLTHGRIKPVFYTPEQIQEAAEGAQVFDDDPEMGAEAFYVRMTTLRETPGGKWKRGGARNVATFAGFWFDGDFGEEGHKPGKAGRKGLPNPPDADAMRAVYTEAGLPGASVEWNSGGGLNRMWLLDEPITVDTDAAYGDLVEASRRWQGLIEEAGKRLGYKCSGLANLDRLMRMPGSVNRKVWHAPKPVTATYSGLRYGLDDLMALIPEPPAPIRTPEGDWVNPATGEIVRTVGRGVVRVEGEITPWDDFNERGPGFDELLAADSWTLSHTTSAGVVHWIRPGKDVRYGTSATVGYYPGVFYVFTDGAGIPANKAYTKAAYWAYTRHGAGSGEPDWAACASELRSMGYGSPLPKGTGRGDHDDMWGGLLDKVGQVITAGSTREDDTPSDDPPGDSGGRVYGRAMPDGSRMVGIRASSIPPKRTEWLWDTTAEGASPTSGGRIPRDMLAVAAGLPGTGKSQTATWMAARITRGELPGCHFGTPRSVIYAATEDDWQRTIVPRMIAAGADMDRIIYVTVQSVENRFAKITLPTHVHHLGQYAQENDVALVVLDPLLSHIGGKINANAETEVRAALEPLVSAAGRYGFTVLGLSHFNKNSGNSDPMERLMGSRGFSALLRSLIVFAEDKDNDGEGDGGPGRKFVMSQAKNNLGRTDLPSLEYTIASFVVDTVDGPAYTSRMVLGGESQTSVEEQLENSGKGSEARSAAKDCQEWLRSYLMADGGQQTKADITQAARKEGYSESTLYRAKEKLKIGGRPSGFAGGKSSMWYLPDA